jgi:transcriptional regulator with XRE-family HTH domain
VNREVIWVSVFATNVLQRRRQMGLSQEELSHRVGVDVRYLGGIERAQRNPSLKVISAIAAALDTTPSALLTNID